MPLEQRNPIQSSLPLPARRLPSGAFSITPVAQLICRHPMKSTKFGVVQIDCRHDHQIDIVEGSPSCVLRVSIKPEVPVLCRANCKLVDFSSFRDASNARFARARDLLDPPTVAPRASW